MPTYIWNSEKETWEARSAPLLAFVRNKYSLYVLDDLGESIHGKKLISIKDEEYPNAHEKGTAHAVMSEDAAAQVKANKAKFREPTKVVAVGMDQWVITNIHKDAAVCTSGIIGCIGIALIGKGRTCVTHVLDGFLDFPDGFVDEPGDTERNSRKVLRPEYRKALDGMMTAMGTVERAIFVASSSIYVYKCKILENWLKESEFAGLVEQKIGGGFIMRVAGDSWDIVLIDKPTADFPGKCCTVSASEGYLIGNGTLSERAADSGA